MPDSQDHSWPASVHAAVARANGSAQVTGPWHNPPLRVPPVEPPPPRPTLDYQVVRQLQRRVSDALAPVYAREQLDEAHQQLEAERATSRVVAAYVDQQRRDGIPLTDLDEGNLIDAVLAELAGLGRLYLLLADPTVENITIKGHAGVRVERTDGRVEFLGAIADDDTDLIRKFQALARRSGSPEKAFGDSWPMMSLQLAKGQRLAAVYNITPQPVGVIRLPGTIGVTLDQLVDYDRIDPNNSAMIDPLLRDFLRAAMAAHLNIMVAGVGGSGKTTIVRALIDEIPRDEWFVLMEEVPELVPDSEGQHPWVVEMQARDGFGEKTPDGRRIGQITLSDLIPVSLQLNAQRIVVGEVRGREVGAMLQAMSTSNGSLSTVHARDPSIVFDRIAELAGEGKENGSERHTYLQVANALDLIVFVRIINESNLGGRKHRFVSHVVEIDHIGDNGRPRTTTIFGPGPDGRAVPQNQPDRLLDALRLTGYDPSVLAHHQDRGLWARPLDRKIWGRR